MAVYRLKSGRWEDLNENVISLAITFASFRKHTQCLDLHVVCARYRCKGVKYERTAQTVGFLDPEVPKMTSVGRFELFFMSIFVVKPDGVQRHKSRVTEVTGLTNGIQ